MRFFLNNHPYLSVLMLGMVCITVIKTTYIIATDGEIPSVLKSKDKDEKDKEDEE